MAAIDIDEEEVFMDRYNDVEWVDNVAKYQCTRCHKVLVQHYISNCQHKFCLNCKQVMDDGSERWRCPKCREFIKDMGRQDIEFRDKVFKLRLYCPNKKYGCQHICPFHDLKKHLKDCTHTREDALPVLYKENITAEMVDRMLSIQLAQLRNETREQMAEIRKVCDDKDNEDNRKLRVEVDQLKQRMSEMEKKQKDRKLKLKTKLFLVNNRIDGVQSDLTVETTRLRNEMIEAQKNQPMKNDFSTSESLSLAVEENKSRILELKGKTEAYNEMMDANYRKTNDLFYQLKKEQKKHLKTKIIEVEQTMSEIKTAQERKWAETKDRIDQCYVDISDGNLKAETYKAEVTKAKAETDKKMAEILKRLEKTSNKAEVEKKLKSIKTELDTFKISNKKEHLSEMKRRDLINKEINEKNHKMTQEIELIKRETENVAIKIEENKEKVKEQTNHLSKKFDKKMESLEQTMKATSTAQERKWAETNDKIISTLKEEEEEKRAEVRSIAHENSSQILSLSTKMESFQKDLQKDLLNQSKCKNEVDKCLLEIRNLNEIAQSLQTEVKASKAEVADMNSKQIKLIKKETKQMTVKLEENQAYLEQKLNGLIPTLRTRLDEKMSEWNNKMESLEQTMKATSTAQERKWTETKDRVDQCCVDINNGNAKVEVYKAEVEKAKTEAEEFKINIKKEILGEIDRKIDSVNKEINKRNTKMTQQVERIKQEVIEEGKRYTDEKLKEMISPISKKLEEKMTECNQIITTTRDNQLRNHTKIEQKVLHLQSFILLRNPQMDNFTLAEDKCNFQPDFTWKISGIKEKLKQKTFEINSESFTWSGYPVQAQAKMEVKQDNQVWVSLCLKEINKRQPYHLKLIPNVYYVLRDRSGNRDTKHRSRSCIHLFRSPFNRSITFEQLLIPKSWLTNPLYVVDDCVVVEVYVEPPSTAQLVHSYDGTLVWAIDNYHKRKEMKKEGLVWYFEGPYFYTAPNGYRVRVRMWLDGCGEYVGKGLTANINFLTGEFDADLSLTFPHLTTITLFNRKYPQRNITKTVDQDIQTNKDYIVDMCSHEEIKNVIENDTVFFKVTIKPKN